MCGKIKSYEKSESRAVRDCRFDVCVGDKGVCQCKDVVREVRAQSKANDLGTEA